MIALLAPGSTDAAHRPCAGQWDVVEAGGWSWTVRPSSGTAVQVFCGAAAPIQLQFPAALRAVQLGVPRARAATGHCAALVAVDEDGTAWALQVRAGAPAGAYIDVRHSDGINLRQHLHEAAGRHQLAALATWEHLCCRWGDLVRLCLFVRPPVAHCGECTTHDALNKSSRFLAMQTSSLPLHGPPAVPVSLAGLASALAPGAASSPSQSIASLVAGGGFSGMVVAAAVVVLPPTPGGEPAWQQTEQLACRDRHVAAAADAEARPPAYLIATTVDGNVQAYPLGVVLRSGEGSGMPGSPAPPSLPLVACRAGGHAALLPLPRQRGAAAGGPPARLVLHAVSGRIAPAAANPGEVVVLVPGLEGSAGAARPAAAGGPFAAELAVDGSIDSMAVCGQTLLYSCCGRVQAVDCSGLQVGDSSTHPRATALGVSEEHPPLLVATIGGLPGGSIPASFAVLFKDGSVRSMAAPSPEALRQRPGQAPAAGAAAEVERDLQASLDALASLAERREGLLRPLRQLDSSIADLAAAIPLAATLRAPAGLHCSVRPLQALAHTLGATTSGLVVEVSVHNRSPLALASSWGVAVALSSAVADGSPAGAVVHAAPLPALGSGAVWAQAVELRAEWAGRGSLVVLLTYHPAGAAAAPGTAAPVAALLHSVELDAVHCLPCTPSALGAGSGAARAAPTSARVLLGVPKLLYGLAPSPAAVLEELVAQGLSSLPAQPRSADLLLTPSTAFSPALLGAPPPDTKPARLRGQLVVAPGRAAPGSIAAALASDGSQQQRASSQYALLEVVAEVADPAAALRAHAAVLRRAQLLERSLQGLRPAGGGLRMPGGVLVPAALLEGRRGMPVEDAVLEAALMQLRGLKDEALRLRDAAAELELQAGAGGGGGPQREAALAQELLQLTVALRRAAGCVPVLL
jgi:hypothetical protein